MTIDLLREGCEFVKMTGFRIYGVALVSLLVHSQLLYIGTHMTWWLRWIPCLGALLCGIDIKKVGLLGWMVMHISSLHCLSFSQFLCQLFAWCHPLGANSVFIPTICPLLLKILLLLWGQWRRWTLGNWAPPFLTKPGIVLSQSPLYFHVHVQSLHVYVSTCVMNVWSFIIKTKNPMFNPWKLRYSHKSHMSLIIVYMRFTVWKCCPTLQICVSC